MPNKTCLQCRKKPKLSSSDFCSDACAKKAAKCAPGFLKIPKNHVKYREGEYWKDNCLLLLYWTMSQSWRNSKTAGSPKAKNPRCRPYTSRRGLPSRVPPLKNIGGSLFFPCSCIPPNLSCLITARHSNNVEAKGKFKKRGLFSGNERKLFRGARRACQIGVKTQRPCHRKTCTLCETIRVGFGPQIQKKLKSKRCVASSVIPTESYFPSASASTLVLEFTHPKRRPSM